MDKIILTKRQLNKIIKESYLEGYYRYEHGSLTGCPYLNLRETMVYEEVQKEFQKRLQRGESLTLPIRKKEI